MSTDFVHSWPKARKRHRCQVCGRSILPGETYWREAGLDRGAAWTNRYCEHCERVVWRWDDDYVESIVEALEENDPGVYAQMLAGWRYPDGGLLPVPYGSSCVECGTRVEFRMLWCGPCDDVRIERLNAQFAEISRLFQGSPS